MPAEQNKRRTYAFVRALYAAALSSSDEDERQELIRKAAALEARILQEEIDSAPPEDPQS